MKLLFAVVLFVVAIVLAITVAIVAAAPYIAIGIVVVGAIYLWVAFEDREDPPSGPPAVR